MKKIIGALVTAAAITFAGAAQAELMDSTFGNTVTVTAADGTLAITYHFSDDGTVHMITPGGEINGTWELTGVNLCITAGEDTSCNDIEDRDVGETWDVTDDNGTMTIAIISGH